MKRIIIFILLLFTSACQVKNNQAGNHSIPVEISHQITLITQDDSKIFQSTALTVGEALGEAINEIKVSDYIAPPPETPIIADTVITYRPAKLIRVEIDGKVFYKNTHQNIIGKALSETGLSLNGLDTSQPAENTPIPTDGAIKIIRTREEILLSQTTLPYKKIVEYGSEIPAGEQKIIQPGEYGILINHSRKIFQEEIEIFNSPNIEIVIRQPRDSITRLSTQLSLETLNTSLGELQYWRAVQMYTTSYSPCRSGTKTCLSGTASGIPLQYGVVALIPSLYNQLAGAKVYIPGYGIGVIADVGGGFPDGRPWIDLGYSDADFQSWSGYHTIYFLAPAPEFLPAGLQ